MARSHLARLAAAAAWLAVVLPAGAGLAGLAEAQAARVASTAPPLTVTITSVTPSYLRQGQAVTISGLVSNTSGTAENALSVRLLASNMPFTSRLDLEHFAAGSYTPPETQVSVRRPARPRLGARQSWRWTIRLPARSLSANCFGVYPLTVQAGDSVLQTATDQVPLPYWPSKPANCPGQHRPRPFPISWIWPLIDVPHQDACRGLTDNRLAASIAPSGRLGYLLAVGARYAAKAALTWAVDPALLDSVRAMKQHYRAGTSAVCRVRSLHPANPEAGHWLAELRRATAGRPLFVTPYADVDVTTLVGHGNTADLHRSLALGYQAARRILRRRGLVSAALAARQRSLSAIAWPPGGTASEALLTFLAIRHISAVVLTAPAGSPVAYTPGAVTSALAGTGKRLRVLLADRAITALLRSKLTSSGAPGARVDVSQLYLAETAMIVAERPGKTRPIVVAPPRRWDPTRTLAGALLGETVRAPWLKPSTAGQLVSMQPEHVYRKLTQYRPPGEQTERLLGSVSRLDHKLKLLQSIRLEPDSGLYRAVAGIESSSWRGDAAKQATAALARTWRYVDGQLHGVSFRGGGGHGSYHVTFGGSTAPVNVSIHNGLNYWIKVGLRVQATRAVVSGVPSAITIPPRSYSSPVKLTVHVTANHAELRLSLVAPADTPAGGRRLPAAPQVLLIHPTAFGVVALAIVAVALTVFVFASAYRAIRAGRPPPDGQDSAGVPDPGGSDPAGAGAEGADAAGARSAGARPAGSGSADSAEPWSEDDSAQPGLADLAAQPEHTGSVGLDRPELTPAGPAVIDQEPAAPSRRTTQEPL